MSAGRAVNIEVPPTPPVHQSNAPALDTDALHKAVTDLCQTMRMRRTAVDQVVAIAFENPYLKAAQEIAHTLTDSAMGPNFVVRAVRYLSDAYAIPPLEGDVQWFRDALDVLIELACPTRSGGPEHDQFLRKIEAGIRHARARAA